MNNISRRDFIKTTAVGTVGAVGAGGLLIAPGCKKEGWFAIPAFGMNILGATSYKATIAEYELSKNKDLTSWVKDSGTRIRDVVKQSEGSKVNGFEWSFELLEDQTINAWCMPGARIAFYEGIMDQCKNENGVAIVMGHEVAHAVYNHSGQRMAQQLAIQLGITALSAVIEKRFADPDDSEIQKIARQVFGVGLQIGGQLALLAYSRKHEHEADKLGLIYAAKAGYDPREAPEFWKRMSALGGGGPQFLSTHPSNDSRIKALNDAMPEALQYYKPA